MRRAEDITFIIGANSKRFRSELNSTHRLLSRFAAALTPVIAGFSLRRIIADLDDIGKKAGRVGLTTDQLQELRFAGEQSGVAINALDIGMQRFARRIAEVASGANNDLAKVLRANNIALRDQEGNLRDQVDILGDYADLIKRAGNEQDRTRLAFLAFDSEGVALVNTLRDGRQGLEEMRKSARDLGVVIDKDAIAAAERMNNRFNEIFSSLSATFKGFVVNTAEQFETLFQSYDTSTPLEQIEKRIEELRSQRTDISQNGLPLFAGWFDTVERNVSMIDKQIARLRELQRVAEKGLDPRQRSYLPDEGDKPTTIPDRKDEEERRKLAAKAEKQARAIKQVVEALELEYANLSRTQAQQRIYNELKRAGVDINSQAGQQIAELVTAIEAENRALELNREALEQLEDRQEAVRAGQEYLISSAAGVGEAFVEGSDKGIAA